MNIEDEYEIDEIDESLSFLESLSESEFTDLEETVYELMDQYIEFEFIHYSSSTFMTDFIEDIAHILYQWLYQSDICREDDYDELTDWIEELSEVFFDMFEIPGRTSSIAVFEEPELNIPYRSNQIQYLQNTFQPAQRTPEWYEYRYNMITASNIWKVFSSDAQCNSIIYEKCKPLEMNLSEYGKYNTQSPMHWGNKYEPVSVAVYENRYGTRVGEFGCIQHRAYPFIGASPDGIVINPESDRYGRMLEIKNIVNREITGIPLESYWVQMQVQMETCELDDCDFLETRFTEYDSADSFYGDIESTKEKGIILYFSKPLTEYGRTAPVYKYMPLSISLQKEQIDDWIREQVEIYRSELILFQVLYWKLDELSCVYVKRNRLWFQSAVPKIDQVWKIIESERVSGYDHRASKKKKITQHHTEVELLHEDDKSSYIIHNLPVSTSICLIKLDGDGNVL